MTYENWIAIAEGVKGHKLRRDDDGCVDGFVCCSGFHNGPGCETCGDSWCEHCTKPEDIDACDGGVELQAVRAKGRIRDAAPELLEALNETLEHYLQLANSGDAGNWDPETEPKVIKARAAIAKALGEGQ